MQASDTHRASRALLLFLSLVLCSHSVAAYEDDEPSTTPGTPDFRFKQPWVIVGMRGGWAFNLADSDIYDFLTENLTLSDSDFSGPAFALDVGVRATSWLDVVLGFEVSGRRSKSHFKDFIESNGDEIEQKTTLTQIPLTASLKFYPIGRGRQVGKYAWIRSTLVPYLGGGLGATWYKLTQDGDFVDFADETIFEAKLKTDAWAFAQHAFFGIDIKITRNFGAVLEGRYYWADASVKGDFVGFDSIDLNGARVMAGFNLRL